MNIAQHHFWRMRYNHSNIKSIFKKTVRKREAFKNSSLYAQFHDKKNWTPAPEDWQALLDKIDLIYPTLASTLSKTLPGSTISEKTFMLSTVIQVKPTVIARLLCCSDTNITMLRKRLYKKHSTKMFRLRSLIDIYLYNTNIYFFTKLHKFYYKMCSFIKTSSSLKSYICLQENLIP